MVVTPVADPDLTKMGVNSFQILLVDVSFYH